MPLNRTKYNINKLQVKLVYNLVKVRSSKVLPSKLCSTRITYESNRIHHGRRLSIITWSKHGHIFGQSWSRSQFLCYVGWWPSNSTQLIALYTQISTTNWDWDLDQLCHTTSASHSRCVLRDVEWRNIWEKVKIENHVLQIRMEEAGVLVSLLNRKSECLKISPQPTNIKSATSLPPEKVHFRSEISREIALSRELPSVWTWSTLVWEIVPGIGGIWNVF